MSSLFYFSCQAQNIEGELVRNAKKGYLMLIGGGISQQQADLFYKYANKDTIIIVPSAFSDKEIYRDKDFSKLKRRFSKLGIEKVKFMHTRDRKEANNPNFYKKLRGVQGVFFMGGRTQNLVDTYVGTKFHTELKNLLQRNGIIAGVSAGSGAQASFFNAKKSILKGFQFLEGVIIMNHFFKRNKQFDYTAELKEHRDLMGIGIDDNTAIFYSGRSFEVVGSSYVAIYDGKYYSRYKDSIYALPVDSERFYVLQDGDRYDLDKREVISNKRLEPINLEVDGYVGNYKSVTNAFSLELKKQNETLILTNSWGWEPYPIYPFEKDLFFAKNRTMWFKFHRDETTQEITGVDKLKSPLQNIIINTLKKIE